MKNEVLFSFRRQKSNIRDIPGDQSCFTIDYFNTRASLDQLKQLGELTVVYARDTFSDVNALIALGAHIWLWGKIPPPFTVTVCPADRLAHDAFPLPGLLKETSERTLGTFAMY
jgi:hypothetical protein